MTKHYENRIRIRHEKDYAICLVTTSAIFLTREWKYSRPGYPERSISSNSVLKFYSTIVFIFLQTVSFFAIITGSQNEGLSDTVSEKERKPSGINSKILGGSVPLYQTKFNFLHNSRSDTTNPYPIPD